MKLPLFPVLRRFATDRKVWERVLAGLYCPHIEHTKTERISIKNELQTAHIKLTFNNNVNIHHVDGFHHGRHFGSSNSNAFKLRTEKKKKKEKGIGILRKVAR